MKNIVSIATIGAAALLSACGTTPTMTDAEKDQISQGKLVEFTKYYNGISDKMYSGKKLYICAVATDKPTVDTPCYPKLSAYYGNVFSAAGIPVVDSKEKADRVIYATLAYFYAGAEGTGFSDPYRALIAETIESSLEKGTSPEMSKETMDEIFKKDEAVQKDVAHESTLEAVGKVAVGIASLAIGGVNGGLYAGQALNSMANPGSVVAPHGTQSPKEMIINLHEKGEKAEISKGPQLDFFGVYDGPLDMFQAFYKLFPSAVHKTAGLFAENTLSAKTGYTQ